MKRVRKSPLPVALTIAVALFSVPMGHAEDKVKLTGDEIREILFTKGNVIYGVDHINNSVWIGTALGDGKRHFYWQHLSSKTPRAPFPNAGEITGTASVVGDQQCTKGYSENRCFDLYRVGKDKYETWFGDTLQTTWYRAN